MTSDEHTHRKRDGKPATQPDPKQETGGLKRGDGAQPEWTSGLRQLYDAVVDEPLPDSFRDLLAQMDSDN